MTCCTCSKNEKYNVRTDTLRIVGTDMLNALFQMIDIPREEILKMWQWVKPSLAM